MKPFFSIWIKPLETFKNLEERRVAGKDNYIEYLFALISLSLYLPQFNDISKFAGADKPLGFVVVFTLAPILGLLIYKYVISYILWQLGKMLHGKATLDEIRMVLAYSLIPALIHLVIVAIFIIPAIQSGNLNLILNQHPATFIIILIFILRNLILGLSYFNKFSFGYAVLTITISGVIFETISLLVKH